MERGVVIGGLLVGVSLLLAAVLNSYATRDAVVMPSAARVVAPEYDKPELDARAPAQPALPSLMPGANTPLPKKNEDALGRPLDLARMP